VQADSCISNQQSLSKRTLPRKLNQHPDILTFVAADVTAQLFGQLASSATANQPLNSEGALAL